MNYLIATTLVLDSRYATGCYDRQTDLMMVKLFQFYHKSRILLGKIFSYPVCQYEQQVCIIHLNQNLGLGNVDESSILLGSYYKTSTYKCYRPTYTVRIIGRAVQ